MLSQSLASEVRFIFKLPDVKSTSYLRLHVKLTSYLVNKSNFSHFPGFGGNNLNTSCEVNFISGTHM